MSMQRIEPVKEFFKTIRGFSRYEVSNLGRIRRKKYRYYHKANKCWIDMPEMIMKQRLHPEGFYFIDVKDDEGKRRTLYIHKAVAMEWCINLIPEKKTIVVHLDGDTKNNNSINLEWADPSEAMKLQFKLGKKDNFKVWKKRKKLYGNGYKTRKAVKWERRFINYVKKNYKDVTRKQLLQGLKDRGFDITYSQLSNKMHELKLRKRKMKDEVVEEVSAN